MVVVTQPLGSAEARGKLGGLVYNTWRGIHYVRTKVSPANQNTPRRLAIRAKAKSCTLAWQALTDAQRTSWNLYAADHLDPYWTGNPKRNSGYNWFVRTNIRLLDMGLSIISIPPVRANSWPIATLAATVDDAIITVDWSLPPAAPEADLVIDLWHTKASSPGRRPKIELAKHKHYRPSEDGSFELSWLPGGHYGIFGRTIDESTGLSSPWSLVEADITPGVPFSQGPLLPTAAENNDTAGAAWSAPEEISVEDEIAATVDIGAEEMSDDLLGYDFGFAIPEGATITGVAFDLLVTNALPATLYAQLWNAASLGHRTSQPLDTEPAFTWYSFGSDSNLWGAELTPAIVNSSDFGVVIAVEGAELEGTLTTCDVFNLTIYYTT